MTWSIWWKNIGALVRPFSFLLFLPIFTRCLHINYSNITQPFFVSVKKYDSDVLYFVEWLKFFIGFFFALRKKHICSFGVHFQSWWQQRYTEVIEIWKLPIGCCVIVLRTSKYAVLWCIQSEIIVKELELLKYRMTNQGSVWWKKVSKIPTS